MDNWTGFWHLKKWFLELNIWRSCDTTKIQLEMVSRDSWQGKWQDMLIARKCVAEYGSRCFSELPPQWRQEVLKE